MIFRFIRCSLDTYKQLTYHAEDVLLVYYENISEEEKRQARTLLSFYCDYAKLFSIKVLFFLTSSYRDVAAVIIIDRGVPTFVEKSVEDGATHRCVYKGLGISVGDDYNNPLNCNLLLGDVFCIVSVSDKMIDRVATDALFAYKKSFPVPVVFVFADASFLVDKKIEEIDVNVNFSLKEFTYAVKNKDGYMKIHVID